MNQRIDPNLVNHIQHNDREFAYLRETISKMEDARHLSESNHWKALEDATIKMEDKLGELADNISEMTKSITELSTDSGWMKKFFWIIASSSIATFATAVIRLIIVAK